MSVIVKLYTVYRLVGLDFNSKFTLNGNDSIKSTFEKREIGNNRFDKLKEIRHVVREVKN